MPVGGLGPTGQWVRARSTEGAQRLLDERELEHQRVRPGSERLTSRQWRAVWFLLGVLLVAAVLSGLVT